MKDFKHFGLKQRRFVDHNYNAIWNNLVTTRIGEGSATELPPEYSEFYDVGINTRCNACCPWCYVSATDKGEDYEDICSTWTKWMDLYTEGNDGIVTVTTKPFQIAIGELIFQILF